jgi:hypothetical protein
MRERGARDIWPRAETIRLVSVKQLASLADGNSTVGLVPQRRVERTPAPLLRRDRARRPRLARSTVSFPSSTRRFRVADTSLQHANATGRRGRRRACAPQHLHTPGVCPLTEVVPSADPSSAHASSFSTATNAGSRATQARGVLRTPGVALRALWWSGTRSRGFFLYAQSQLDLESRCNLVRTVGVNSGDSPVHST